VGYRKERQFHLYYSIYLQLNDIENLPLKSTLIVCYADNTVLKFFENTYEAMFKTITEDLTIIEHWLIINNLFLNYNTTVILLHSWKTNTLPNKKDFILHDNTCNTYDIKCQCKKINIMNNFKYLGIEMCSNMKWNEQINSMTQKTRKMIFIMREFRDILNKKDLRVKVNLLSTDSTKCLCLWLNPYTP